MKSSRAAVHRKTHALPELRFEEQQLTSFSGMVLIQQLFAPEAQGTVTQMLSAFDQDTDLRVAEHCSIAHCACAARISRFAPYPVLQR